jgi:N-acetylneuraminic acid mutarotase
VTSSASYRDYGSAVMYAPGKILIMGGGGSDSNSAPKATAEVIDLNQGSPSWRSVQSMHYARRHLNATLLPTGEVLVTGGTSAAGFNNPAGAVHAAEVWNPGTEEWTTLASNSVIRIYHSTSLLLPDGRVLHSGSGDGGGSPTEENAELVSPPYLFKGARPVITSAPSSVGYNEDFSVDTPNGASIAQVSLIRLGSVTHAFDQNQRFNQLTFSESGGGLSIHSPANPNLAPPGHYLLFLVNDNGVPSVGKIIRIQ